MRYCAKVALCIVAGYVIGLTSHRLELSVVLTTIVITALPTYGASLRKMILRIVGTAIGGVIVLLTIMIVTPNFETLLSYMLVVFIVLFISGYAALASGRNRLRGQVDRHHLRAGVRGAQSLAGRLRTAVAAVGHPARHGRRDDRVLPAVARLCQRLAAAAAAQGIAR
jgi:uncharacterized membrane protein YccC